MPGEFSWDFRPCSADKLAFRFIHQTTPISRGVAEGRWVRPTYNRDRVPPGVDIGVPAAGSDTEDNQGFFRVIRAAPRVD
jgi:hypothetical protein